MNKPDFFPSPEFPPIKKPQSFLRRYLLTPEAVIFAALYTYFTLSPEGQAIINTTRTTLKEIPSIASVLHRPQIDFNDTAAYYEHIRKTQYFDENGEYQDPCGTAENYPKFHQACREAHPSPGLLKTKLAKTFPKLFHINPPRTR